MIKKLMSVAAVVLACTVSGPFAGAAWAASGSHWGADYFPNVPLVTQDGKTVRLYDDLLKGKKVLVNFMFSSCDKACPLDTAKMAEVQRMLGDRIGRDIFMYSITLDPEHDTPAVLKSYAETFKAGPGWLFLTGKREDIDKVRDRFGDRAAKEEHANSVRFGDVDSGQWMRMPLAMDRASLVTEIVKTLFPTEEAGKVFTSYADAPLAKVPETGQILFSNRCSACHTIGKGELLGPDLKGVTVRRERSWIARYLAGADRMRAAKDPIALDLAKRYKVVMPNLSLNSKELGDLLTYLDAQNAPRASGTSSAGNVAAAQAGGQPATLAHEAHHEHHHDQHHAHHRGAGEAK